MKEIQNKIILMNKELNELIPTLNNGGCGLFIFYFLKHHRTLFTSVKIVGYDKNCFDCLEYLYGDSCTHFMLNVFINKESLGFDGLNIQPIFFEGSKYKFYSENSLLTALLKKERWNNSYNTNQNHLLEFIIKNIFEPKTKLYYVKLKSLHFIVNNLKTF